MTAALSVIWWNLIGVLSQETSFKAAASSLLPSPLHLSSLAPPPPPHLEFNELTERSQRHSVPHCCDWGGGSVWCVSVWMEAVRFWCGRDTFVEGVLVLKLVMGRHDVRVTRLVELWYQLQPHRHVVTSVVALDVWVASCTRCLKNPHSSLSFC